VHKISPSFMLTNKQATSVWAAEDMTWLRIPDMVSTIDEYYGFGRFGCSAKVEMSAGPDLAFGDGQAGYLEGHFALAVAN
jgi:hypothetical protein